jgi:hypothetical protein
MKFNGFDKPLIVFLILCDDRLFYYFGTGLNKGDWVVIEVDTKRVARFPLTAYHFAHVPGPLGTTEVEIKNGRARIVCSLCKLKVCIKLGYIQYADSLSACLPNKVVVRIDGKAQRGLDVVVG